MTETDLIVAMRTYITQLSDVFRQSVKLSVRMIERYTDEDEAKALNALMDRAMADQSALLSKVGAEHVSDIL